MAQSRQNLQNLAEGGEDSLRALIRAIVPEANTNTNGKYGGDVVNKLTEKLTELMGPAATQDFNQARNEKGELVNEEGLPIIDINEPADSTQLQYTKSRPAPITVEPLIPLTKLPSTAREQLQARRDRILNLLEEEETQAQLAEEQREAGERDVALRKRREENGKEQDKIKAARELQKKMGRALIQNVGKAKEKEKEEQEAQHIRDEEAEKRKSPSMKKKTVAFVDSPGAANDENKDAVESSSKPLDWGDVSPGRLRSTKRPTLMSQSLLDKHPMKMSVVERIPGGQPTFPKPPSTPRPTIDSDDESEPEEPSESDTEFDPETDEEPVLDDDAVDLAYAQHQREIALEYYRKGNHIRETATAAMMNHSHDADERNEPISEMAQESTKPAISQFRANKLASAYNASTSAASDSASTSMGASVLPASSTRTIQKAIRTGKLDDDGKLIGGEADSASEEEDQGIQEVLNLLRKGEVYNLGPDGNYRHAVRPNPNSDQAANRTSTPTSSSTNAASSSTQAAAPAQATTLPPPTIRTKTSRFKAARAAAGRPSGASIPGPSTPSDTLSPSVTPISHAGRSSPKLDASTPISAFVSERNTPAIKSPSPTKPPYRSPSPFSMIVESPSFPMVRGPQSHFDAAGISSAAMSTGSLPSFQPPGSLRRPHRPPPVIASSVKESRPAASQAEEDASAPQKQKVSRFMSERM